MTDTWKQITDESLYEINQDGVVRHRKVRGKPLKVHAGGKVVINNRVFYIDDLLAQHFGTESDTKL